MREITYAEVHEVATRLVDTVGGSFVYRPHGGNPESAVRCDYVETDDKGAKCPSCGVGKILADPAIGVPIEVLGRLDELPWPGFLADPWLTTVEQSQANGNDVKDTIDAAGYTFTPKAAAFLWAFQRHQDNRDPYGEVLHNAVLIADRAGYADEVVG